MKSDLKGYKITSADAIKAMDNHQLNMIFPKAKLIQEGGDNIDGDIELMKESILETNDIVDPIKMIDFKSYVKNVMSRSLLENIGGGMSSFEKKSFRLNQLNASGLGYGSMISKYNKTFTQKNQKMIKIEDSNIADRFR